MSERALGFVEEWVSDHIRAQGVPPDGDNAQAKALASQCLADANAQGISAAEIGEAIDDLTEFMAGAIAEENDREGHHLDDGVDERMAEDVEDAADKDDDSDNDNDEGQAQPR